jgi:hypothetical protein
MRGLVGRERPRSAKGATAAPGEAIAVMLAKAVVAGVLPIIAGVVGSMPPVDVRKATLAQRAGPVRVTLAPCRVAPPVDFMRSMSQVRSHAMGRRGRHPASDNRTRSCSCHVSMLQSITGGGRGSEFLAVVGRACDLLRGLFAHDSARPATCDAQQAHSGKVTAA